MSRQSISLRLANSADARTIAVMSRDLIETGLDWSWTTKRVEKSIRGRDTIVLTANTDERLVGFAIMYFGDDQAHLNLLAVRPSYRRAGVGQQMMAWLEKSARVAGITTVYLEVRANNAIGRSFYRDLGYRDVARLPRYYGDRETAIRMGRDLMEGVEATEG